MSKQFAVAAARHGYSRRGFTVFLAFGLIAAALVIFAGRAGGALPSPALFELDGNALTDHATAGIPDDWDRIYCAQTGVTCAPNPGANSSNATNFITEPATVFGGGSSDTNDIPTWGCTGGSPNKNLMENVFAASYTDPITKHTIVYFGADRVASTNGDSNIGFWFIQDPTFGNNCTTTSKGTFTGVHHVGDVFVASAYTNGGSQPTIDVYKWNGSGLTQVANADPACNNNGIGPPPQDACAIGNADGPRNVAWPLPAGTTQIPTNGFFEGGIDLNTLFQGAAVPCFTNFLGETRASQSANSELKNFGSGGLDTCGSIELKKVWVGPTGSTNLSIGTSASGTEVVGPVAAPPASTTGPQQVPANTYHVSESLTSTQTPGGYQSKLDCVNTKNNGSVTVSTSPDQAASGRSDSLSVASGDRIVCTYTNTFNLYNPTITTAASGGVTVGSAIHDVATLLSASGTPALGTVTFNVYAASDTTCAHPLNGGTAIAAVSTGVSGGNPTYTSADFTPAHAGSYVWVASFAGDSLNNPAGPTSCADPAEVSVVKQATPTLTTAASGPVAVGSAIHDVATLHNAFGTPDASTVTFNVYAASDTTCLHPLNGGTAIATASTGGTPSALTYTSGNFTPAHAGSYVWVATFAGDTDNAAPKATACSDPAEVSVVTQAQPTLTTNASGPVQVGSSIHDVATLHNAFGTPAMSTVTFNVYAASDTSCLHPLNGVNAIATVSTGGTPSALTYTSGNFTPAHAGSYVWVATFGGDTDNAAPQPTACNDPAEVSVVSQAQPTLTTNASGPVTVGSAIHDVATLHNPFGTPDSSLVTFDVYAASDTSCAHPLNGNTHIATVSTGGTATALTYTSANFTPAHAGSYVWVASFAGDTDNAKAGPTSCNDAAEVSVVNQAQPTLTTNASGPVQVGSAIHDVATLHNAFGTPAASTVTFNVYAASDTSCLHPLNGATAIATASTGGTPSALTYTSGNFTPAHAGSYVWVATFGGDTDNAAPQPTACNDPAEVSVVTQAQPTLTTDASGPVTVGSSIHDVATLHNAFGTPDSSLVTFDVYAASDTSCAHPLNGNTHIATTSTGGTPSALTYTSGNFTPAHPGSYVWVATFAGDTDNAAPKATACSDPAEVSVVTQAQPTLTTSASGPVQVGSSIHDVATLHNAFGTPDASTVVFNVYAASDTSCLHPLNGATALATVSTGGTPSALTYTSAGFTPTHTGHYVWVATFLGDTDNAAPQPTACNDPAEVSVVTEVAPTVTTSASGPVQVGSSIHDVATLHNAFGTPDASTMVFNVYAASDTSCLHPLNGITALATVSTGGSGAALTYTSASFTPAHAGSYVWVATFLGDNDNAAAEPTACNDPAEVSVVSQANPTLTTNASGPVQVGSAIHDVATLHNAFGTPDPSLVTFDVYAASDTSCAHPLNGNTHIATVSTGGSGAALTYTSGDFTPAHAGSYVWVATFAGDTDNAAPKPTACSDPAEVSVVTPANPTLTTSASGPVAVGSAIHDVATLHNAFGTPDASTVTFNVYASSDTSCAHPLNQSPLAAVSTGGGGAAITYTSADFTPANAGAYVWVATFAGDNDNNGAGPTSCKDAAEVSAVVDANIRITQAEGTGTNDVGQSHTFTVTVGVDLGDGQGMRPAANLPAGSVSVTLTGSNGIPATVTPTGGTCIAGGTDGNGQCTITFDSNSAGQVTGNATVTLTASGVTLTRDTDPSTEDISAGPGGSGPVVKTYVDASVSITGTGTNEVGQPHTFTVTVLKDSGDGNGLVPAANLPADSVTVTLTGSNGIPTTVTPTGGTCVAGTTDGNGQCTITFNSDTAGQVTGNASVTLDVHGISITRDTDPSTEDVSAGPGGSGPVVKTYVDANITITQAEGTGTNEVGQSHTFTVTVMQDSGDGNGLVPAANLPEGSVTVTLTDSNGAVHTTPTGTCVAGTTDGNGQCTITFDSNSAGNVTGNASVTLDVHGVSLTRSTDPESEIGAGPGGSGPVVKTYVDAYLTISPAAAFNNVTVTHTYTVQVFTNDGSGAGYVGSNGQQVSLSFVGAHVGSFTSPSTCTTATIAGVAGQCTVTTSSSTAGTDTMQATVKVGVGGLTLTRTTGVTAPGHANSGNALKTWQQPSIGITKNPKTQTFTSGGTATFTIVVTNTGPVTLTNVRITDPLSPNCAKSSLDIAALGSMAPGASQTYTCTLANVTASFTNVATATGTPLGGGPDVSANDSAPVTVTPPPPPPPAAPPQNPAISITKNPKGQTVEVGQTATFTIVVTNTGDTTLTNVTVADPLSPNCNQSSATIAALASMAPGASVTYNCSLANVGASFTNVATATGTAPSGANVTASDTAPVNVTVPLTPPKPTPTHPAISVVKDPKTQSIGVGGTATFTIKVTNTGDVTLTDVTTSDPLSPNCTKNLGTLAVGQSKTYTCTKDGVTANFENIVTASGKPPTGARVSAKDNANVGVAPFTPPQHPAIGISKGPKSQTVTTSLKTSTTATGANKTTVTYGDAHFTIKVTNTGDVALHSVTVSDPLSPNCNKGLGTLAPHASKSYNCTKSTVTSNFTNVATATGISPKGEKVHATDSANVKVTTKTTSTSGAQFTG
jgi:uncharacterized repeat protein (TIGR01451 family)